jgi:uncharacterized membrane protein YccC
VSWSLAALALKASRPIFAAVAAVITSGAARGQHWRRAIELVVGVSLGIGVADLLVQVIGSGPWQIALVTVLAMLAATLLGGGSMLVTQAGISAILVTAIEHHTEGLVPERLFETLIGGAVALVISHLLFPVNPMAEVARTAQTVFNELATALEETAAALGAGDPERAKHALLRARAIDPQVRAFNDAMATAYETARLAPTRRRALSQLDAYRTAAAQVDFAVRNTRVLARAAISLVRNGQPAPESLPDAVLDLARGVRSLGQQLHAPERGDDTRRFALDAAARGFELLENRDALALSMIVGEIRLTATDLLRGSGLDLSAAQQALDDAVGDDLATQGATPASN